MCLQGFFGGLLLTLTGDGGDGGDGGGKLMKPVTPGGLATESTRAGLGGAYAMVLPTFVGELQCIALASSSGLSVLCAGCCAEGGPAVVALSTFLPTCSAHLEGDVSKLQRYQLRALQAPAARLQAP